MTEPAAPPAEAAAAEPHVRRRSRSAPTCAAPSTRWATSTRRRCSAPSSSRPPRAGASSCRRARARARRPRSACPSSTAWCARRSRRCRRSSCARRASWRCRSRARSSRSGSSAGRKVVAIYGGASMRARSRRSRRARRSSSERPGRVLDHLRQRTLDPSGIRVLVLDEADEMLSMGFARSSTRSSRRCRRTARGSSSAPRSRRTSSASRTRTCATRSSSRCRATRSARSRSTHYVYVHAERRQDRPARAHPRGRGPRERHHLLQHARRDPARGRGAQDARVRRRLAERRSAAERPRARDERDARGAAALPRGDRRRGARHRHLAPDARHQLRLPGDRRAVRAPHGAHGARGPHGDGHRARRAEGHRQPLPPAPHLQDPPDREAAPERGRGEDARRDGPAAAVRRRVRGPRRRTRTTCRSRGACSRTPTPSGSWRGCCATTSGARGGDAPTEAAEARRARNPPPQATARAARGRRRTRRPEPERARARRRAERSAPSARRGATRRSDSVARPSRRTRAGSRRRSRTTSGRSSPTPTTRRRRCPASPSRASAGARHAPTAAGPTQRSLRARGPRRDPPASCNCSSTSESAKACAPATCRSCWPTRASPEDDAGASASATG